ncbi:DUF1002 domain-containing protein [Tepidimicrobium xylanilyticum]|uniref:Uncharacterized protein YpuA, DUF1002 family n=1 Tax=Tepidimicrobium xylanilyticum TaxID=1123352 RepID=A0A1H3D336_9FIRM|nr:DUF1002 domain-containing protein [Tepidimicrobium xylanilyticum]GMG97895.1 hypothetical protein EN5CB1_27210 [Tepidimicrobium xylanilyticum]SDX60883.1 Uncharacterized protein YpuA, DUF1002 family [Tepidimicrobium xylanilyticum]
MKKGIIAFILIWILLIPSLIFAEHDGGVVVALGKNLSEEQKREILNFFNVDESIKIIEVTNEEEREYFGKYIDSNIIGSRAISSVYVKRLPEGEGITVETHNITWVTEDMYRNASITAGIKDAKIIVSSPVKVSGTAALTGIIKAFEDLTGDSISEKEKEIASEEIAKTASLGNEIGKEKAQELINNIKIYIIDNNIKSKGSIKKVAEQMAQELGIELTDEQIDQIVSLMRNISKLNLNIDDIKQQLRDISGKIDKITEQNIEIKSILERILDAIVRFFNRFFG